MTTNFKPDLTRKPGRPRVNTMEREPCFTGVRIKELREERHWSLQRLSDEALELTGERVSPQAISAVELGASQNPTRRILRPLARALGVSLSALFEDEDEEPSRPALASAS